MGIRIEALGEGEKDDGLQAFSEDILKIEINGPDVSFSDNLQEHD